MLGNSITLTPGTLSVDVRDDGVLMVHCINVRSLDEEEAARQILGRFEWFIDKIFE
jgi:multicomponent Na+:H+ antiporter subunit E